MVGLSRASNGNGEQQSESGYQSDLSINSTFSSLRIASLT